MNTYTATDVQIKDMIEVRRSNEKKFRTGLVLDLVEQNVFGFHSISARIAFDKTIETVELTTAQISLNFRNN